MTSPCYFCPNLASQICINSDCTIPPFFCSGKCSYEHLHNGSLKTMSYQHFNVSIDSVEFALTPQLLFKKPVDKMRKEIEATKEYLNEQIKKLDEVMFRYQFIMYSEIGTQLHKRALHTLNNLNYEGRDVTGKDMYNLFIFQHRYLSKTSKIEALKMMQKSLLKDLEKIRQFKIDIPLMGYRERCKKAEILKEEAEKLVKEQKWEAGLKKLDQVMKFNDFDFTVNYFRAIFISRIMSNKNNNKKIESDLNTSSQNNTDTTQKDFTQVYKSLKRALEIDPTSIQALRFLIKTQSKDNKFQEVIKTCTRAIITMDSTRVQNTAFLIEAFKVRANTYYDLKRFHEARKDFVYLCTIDPSNVQKNKVVISSIDKALMQEGTEKKVKKTEG